MRNPEQPIDDSALPQTAQGNVVTPYGVSLPRSLRIADSWRDAVANESHLLMTPAERAALLQVHKLWTTMALRTLRETVHGMQPAALQLEKPDPSEIPHIEIPTAEEVKTLAPESLDAQLSRHAAAKKALAHPTRAELKAFGERTSRGARLQDLQKQSLEAVDENIMHIAHLLRHYVRAIGAQEDPQEQEYACAVLEELLAVAARTAVIMKVQTHPLDADRRTNAVHTVMDAVNELFEHALQEHLQTLPDQVSRSDYATRAKAVLGLFLGKQANRDPI